MRIEIILLGHCWGIVCWYTSDKFSEVQPFLRNVDPTERNFVNPLSKHIHVFYSMVWAWALTTRFHSSINNTASMILTVFAWRRVVLRFSTRNNCCEFLAFYGVITQSVLQSFLKTPVCGASLSHCIISSFSAYKKVKIFHDSFNQSINLLISTWIQQQINTFPLPNH